MALFDENNEIEIEIFKSKILGLEAEVMSLRDKLRIQSKHFAKSIELLAKMDFLLQSQHKMASQNPRITLADCQHEPNIDFDRQEDTNDEITDQQIDEALDKEIYDESDGASQDIEDIFSSEDFPNEPVEEVPEDHSEENIKIELIEATTVNVTEASPESVCKNASIKSTKRKRGRCQDINNVGKKAKRGRSVYSRVDGLYRCPFKDICNYTSKYSSNLPKHIRIHTGERKYSCDYCDKTFADANGRLSHQLRHPESGAQKCSKCKRLIEPIKLEDHMINCKSSKSKKKAGKTEILLQLK